MSACEVGLRKITQVPKNLYDTLTKELESWDIKNSTYNYDRVFGYHKLKPYHVGPIGGNILYPEHIQPIISWLCDIAGQDHSVVRCFLNCIEPNSSFRLHVDTLRVHKLAKRFHIPITHSSDCIYYTYRKNKAGTWDEQLHVMEPGFLYELDNINPHNVKNYKDIRVNFIADVICNDLIDDRLIDTDPAQTKFLNSIFTHGLPISR